MDLGIDRKFLLLIMMVLCLHINMVESQDSSKITYIKKRIKVATMLQPPLVMRDPGSGEYTGLMIDVLKAMGFEFESIESVDDRTYGIEEVPYKLGDLMTKLTEKNTDLAILARVMKATDSSGITQNVTFSLPVYKEGFVPIIKTPSRWAHKYSAMLTLIEPFSAGLWCLIIVMCVLTSAVLLLIRYMSPFEAGNTYRSAPPKSKSNLMYTIASLLGRDHREAPRSLSGRVLTCVWWVFSLMTAGAYVAGLVTIIYKMNPKINTLPFSTFGELVRQDEVKVLVVNGGVTSDFFRFREGPIWRMFKNQKERLIVDNMESALKMVMEGDGKYAVLMQETTAKYLINEQPCDRMQVTEEFGELFYGFACQREETLCDHLEHGILQLQETGRIEQLQSKYYEGKCHQKEQLSYQGLPFVSTFGVGDPTWLYPRTFNINRFGSAFILLGVGFGTAILVLLAEVIFAKLRGPLFSTLTGPGLNEDSPTQRLSDLNSSS